MIVDVHVKDEDIRDGDQGSCSECPVALALSRAIPNAAIHVFDDSVIIMPYDSDRRFSLNLPDNVCDFISSFDNDGDVWPFSFQLELDDADDDPEG
jgi:hypothetical protein